MWPRAKPLKPGTFTKLGRMGRHYIEVISWCGELVGIALDDLNWAHLMQHVYRNFDQKVRAGHLLSD